jgi:hypothetical protein
MNSPVDRKRQVGRAQDDNYYEVAPVLFSMVNKANGKNTILLGSVGSAL